MTEGTGKRRRRRRRRTVATSSPATEHVSAPTSGISVRDTNPIGAPSIASSDSELEAKRVAYYQAAVEGFLENRMERDKSLLVLCTAGVGVVVTLWTAAGVTSRWEIGLGLAAAGAFMAGIFIVLAIFKLNAEYLEKEIQGTDHTDVREKLDQRDRWLSISFCAGLIAALTGALVTTCHKMSEPLAPTGAETTMSDESTADSIRPAITTGVANDPQPTPWPATPAAPSQRLDEGVQGFDRLMPKIETGSQKGFHNLAPKGPAVHPAPAPTPAVPSRPQGSGKRAESVLPPPTGEHDA